MIGLVDYGLSNLRSVLKAFEHLGIETRLVTTPADLEGVERLVLPGVGAFASGMAGLAQAGLAPALGAAVAGGMPLLGICLGMQLLFEWGEEDGRHAGLGLLSGTVLRFQASGLRVPHVGWNRLEPAADHPLLGTLPDPAYAYFVHSYYCRPESADLVLAHTDYGGPFASIVGAHPIYGLQFHPEKSQTVGLRLLANFAALPV